MGGKENKLPPGLGSYKTWDNVRNSQGASDQGLQVDPDPIYP